jgi:hypothetical protein
MIMTLADIVSTCSIAGVTIGDSVERVRAVLGPPQDVLSDKFVTILKYGQLQVCLGISGVIYLAIYFVSDELLERYKIKWEDWEPSPYTTLTETKRIVAKLGLPVEVLTDYEQRTLVLSQSVRLYFTKHARAWRLHSLMVTAAKT